jgi:hypothetical protein
MTQVRELERRRVLIESGLATEEDFEDQMANKMVMTSSGFYKFNHMYRRMKAYWAKIDEQGKDSRYAVHQVPHWFLPEGFLDKDNIDEAKRVMSNHEFRMEYEAEMISDSEGFFKASLLESCTTGSDFSLQFKGDKSSKYIVGIDPNQGGRSSCGIIIVKVGVVNKVVNVIELKKQTTTQELTLAVQDICDNYNIIRIFMDKGGGGKAVCDLLEEGYGGKEPIIDRTNEDHRHMKGRHILELVNFNTSWISDANFTTLSLLEDRKLLFPEQPVSTIDQEAIMYENVTTLKRQMLNIIVTQTGSGLLHFDTPRKGQNKDLYSAFILAGHGIRIVEKELEGDTEPILHNRSGVVRGHGPNSSWGTLDRAGPKTIVTAQRGLNMAVLKKRIK